MQKTKQGIKISANAHAMLARCSIDGFWISAGDKLADGNWIIYVNPEVLARLESRRAEGETWSEVIERIVNTYLRDAAGL